VIALAAGVCRVPSARMRPSSCDHSGYVETTMSTGCSRRKLAKPRRVSLSSAPDPARDSGAIRVAST